MIIKAFELNKLNINKYNFYLFYGENEGFKNEAIKNNFESLYKNQTYRYEEKEILENKDNFINSILSKSLFENKKLIIIQRTSDKIRELIENIISKNITDITIILSSSILEKKSKLRNFFEKEKKTVCVPFYADTIQTLTSILFNFLNKKKISISQQTINQLIERSRGNRQNLNNELEKIENYFLSKQKITSEDILKLTNLAENYNVSELVDNCLAKNSKKTSNILNENNFSSEDCILIIRTFLLKAKRIHKLQKEINNTKNIDQIITNFKPPIFWKDKEIIKKQIASWSLKNIQKIIVKINDVELLIKKNSSNSLNILSDFILNVANKTNN